MFNEKKEMPNQTGERNIIAKNTSLVGDIKSDGDFLGFLLHLVWSAIYCIFV